jgi:hypothetical protein
MTRAKEARVANKPKRSPGELLDAVHKMALDDELARIDEMSDEELEAEMKTLEDASGKTGDPEGTKKRGAAFVADEIEYQKQLAALIEQAVAELTRALTAAAAAPKTPALPRKELDKRLDAVVERAPRLDSALQIAFQKRAREKASDEELRSVIDALERLEAIARALDGRRR